MSDEKPEAKIVEAQGNIKFKMGNLLAKIGAIKVEKRDLDGNLIETVEQKYGDD